jgi:epoxyqueuosine reductase
MGITYKGAAMIEKLQEWAAQRGYRVAWGSRAVVESAQREIEARRSGSEIDGDFFNHELQSILAGGNEISLPTAIIVAKPRSAHSIRFELEGKSMDALLPPTYFRYRALFEDVRMDLTENGLPGAQIEHLKGPLKAIAGRLGLIRYGRNNISYVEGLGSYIQLCGYWTDAKLPEKKVDEGIEPSLLPQCENCGICRSVCPTDAITEERVLLRAERCLTFVNENPGNWPEWLSPRAHNCLLGCLECQRACPANPELPVENTGLVFSPTETRLLLSDIGTMDDRAETGIRSKLAWLGQPYAEPVLGRNFKALLKNI